MIRKISFLIVFLCGIGLGASAGLLKATAESSAKPAFLIVSSDRNPGVDYGPYQRAAGPLAAEAGLLMVATAQEPTVLEGTWPYKNVAIEQFASMQALKDFWFSDEYQAAKKLRDGLSTVNFIVAVEGDG